MRQGRAGQPLGHILPVTLQIVRSQRLIEKCRQQTAGHAFTGGLYASLIHRRQAAFSDADKQIAYGLQFALPQRRDTGDIQSQRAGQCGVLGIGFRQQLFDRFAFADAHQPIRDFGQRRHHHDRRVALFSAFQHDLDHAPDGVRAGDTGSTELQDGNTRNGHDACIPPQEKPAHRQTDGGGQTRKLLMIRYAAATGSDRSDEPRACEKRPQSRCEDHGVSCAALPPEMNPGVKSCRRLSRNSAPAVWPATIWY